MLINELDDNRAILDSQHLLFMCRVEGTAAGQQHEVWIYRLQIQCFKKKKHAGFISTHICARTAYVISGSSSTEMYFVCRRPFCKKSMHGVAFTDLVLTYMCLSFLDFCSLLQ